MNPYTGEILEKENGFWPFYAGEPNGGTLENCVVVWLHRSSMNDQLCDSKTPYGFCNMLPRPTFVLRGDVMFAN